MDFNNIIFPYYLKKNPFLNEITSIWEWKQLSLKENIHPCQNVFLTKT